MSIWRDLPKGGRLYLEPRGADGAVIRTQCRVGISFSASDRGASTEHLFPWPGLDRAMPACAQELTHARSVEPALFEEGGVDECPGACAFAQSLEGRQVSCECQPLGESSEAEKRFLEIYRRTLDQERPPRPPPPEEKEPD